MRILVTGAAGLIGSHLAKRLREDGHFVRGVDWRNPANSNEIRKLDLFNKSACAAAVDSMEQVYHCAADVGGVGYISKEPARLMSNNMQLDINVLEAAAKAGVKRFWYASSASVYSDYHTAQTETDATRPDTGYGAAKMFGEQLCYLYNCTVMPTRIGRLFNVYGPAASLDSERESGLVALCRKVALATDGNEVEVWGDGQQERDFVYVTDAVDAIVRVMNSGHAMPVNIGTGMAVTVSTLVDVIAEVADKRVRKRLNLSKPDGAYFRCAQSSLLRSLGWEPKVSLEAGVGRTYKWVVEQITAVNITLQPAIGKPL